MNIMTDHGLGMAGSMTERAGSIFTKKVSEWCGPHPPDGATATGVETAPVIGRPPKALFINE